MGAVRTRFELDLKSPEPIDDPAKMQINHKIISRGACLLALLSILRTSLEGSPCLTEGACCNAFASSLQVQASAIVSCSAAELPKSALS